MRLDYTRLGSDARCAGGAKATAFGTKKLSGILIFAADSLVIRFRNDNHNG
jgi:hypothetical protein